MSGADGARALYDDLVRHGLFVPAPHSKAAGTFGRGAVFEDVLDRFDAYVMSVAAGDAAEKVTFPPVMDRTILERVNYLDSFPHLCGSIHSFFGNALQAAALAERARSGEPWGDLLGQTSVVMSPAACYPLYPTLTGTLPPGGRLFTVCNWVYRHEPSPEPTRMQAFRVRELIRVGTPEEAVAWREMWLERGKAIFDAVELAATFDVANDPFFGRGGKMLAATQREQKAKFEVLVPVMSGNEPTAVCSFNLHHDHFGSAFDIRTADGAVAHSACLGFGLERVTIALFRTHGFDPAAWPVGVRRVLWNR